MPRCLIALGGNIGPVQQTFADALRRLDALPGVTVVRTSRVFRSRAVGDESGDAFCNAAAELETDLPPLQLLDRLQEIENAFGRTRVVRWGPRTLDLDLLLYGDEVIDHPRLRVPHPACWYRRFVLDPLADIAPEAIHPEQRVSIGELRSRLLPRPLPVALAGADRERRQRLIDTLRPEFPQVAFDHWTDAASQGDDPALLIWLGPAEAADIAEFESLPPIPRLDASAATEDQTAFVRHVLHSALGE